MTIGRQVASPSAIGSVEVTQSTIFRSPVVVFCSAGWPRSTPESRMPMVMPRPSAFGCSLTKSTAPVSKDGLYGFAVGVFRSGPGRAAAGEPDFVPSGAGSSSGISCLRSMACTEESLAAAAMAASARAVGTVART